MDTPVLARLTPSLFSQPRRSRVAPMRLSTSMPPIPPNPANRTHFQGISPLEAHTKPTNAAAMHPEKVPASVIPPSVPVGTRCQVVMRRGCRRPAWPISLETVSAAASESAAAAASK